LGANLGAIARARFAVYALSMPTSRKLELEDLTLARRLYEVDLTYRTLA